MNLITKTTALALYMVKPYLAAYHPFLVIDATCGNGHDMTALAQMLFCDPEDCGRKPGTLLIGIDIQETAVRTAHRTLEEAGFEDRISDGSIRLVCGSHEDLAGILGSTGIRPEESPALPVRAVLFNLGYLPGGDKKITTLQESTLHAVQSALGLLEAGGLICITMYSGHENGAKEKEALLSWAEDLDSRRYHTVYLSMPNQKKSPPEILLITKKQ